MTTMVTGAMGYAGRYIASALAERGEKVIGYNRDYTEVSASNVQHVQGELFDIPRIVATMKSFAVERIIHTAAMSHPDLSIDLPITTVAANIDGTIHLFEAAKMAGLKRIVNFSSETVYGHIEGTVTESSPLFPTTPYGVTKLATEHFGRVYNELYGLSVISLRVSEIYGPGNKMPQILRDIIKTALRGDPFRLATGADHCFQFIHVEDVVEAALLAAQVPSPQASVFNITGGDYRPLREAVAVIKKFIPQARIDIGPGHWHLDRQGRWEIAAAARELGYKPTVKFESGLERYIDRLKQEEY